MTRSRLMPFIICILTVTSTLVAMAAEVAPLELHGRLDDAPFWARLQPPSAAYGGHRALQLVYTPPPAERLDGAHLIDCPFILLDDRSRILAWNGRGSLSFITPLDKRGYRISRELEVGKGEDREIRAQEHRVDVERSWDLRLLPLHLALSWSATGTGSETALDLFAAKPGEPVAIRWSPGSLTVGAATWRAEPDAQGRLATLADETGRTRLQVAGRKP